MTLIKQFDSNDQLALNNDFSSSFTDENVENISIEQPELRHFDLYQVKSLQALSMNCPLPAERHLRVEGAQSLKSIQLNGHHDNRWVIHLDLANFPHALKIEALVEHIDMCWLNEKELLTLSQQSRSKPWHEIYFYELNKMTMCDFNTLKNLSAESLVVFFGSYEKAELPLSAHLSHLVFTDITGIDGLSISRVKDLVIQRARDLRSLVVQEKGLHNLKLHQCPQFSHLNAPTDFTGKEAEFSDSTHQSLSLSGCWNTIKVRRSSICELSAGQIEQLHITDCPNLHKLNAGSPLIFTNGIFAPELFEQSSFSINEGMIRETLLKLKENMDYHLVDALLKQALRQYKPYNVSHSINLLKSLADLGYDIGKLWELRATLQTRNQRRKISLVQEPKRVKLVNWRWNIQADQIFESYEADFLLWLKAKRQQLDVNSYISLMTNTALQEEPAAFFTICVMITDHNKSLTVDEKVDFLKSLMEKIPEQFDCWLNLNEKLLPGLTRLCNYFKQLSTQPISDAHPVRLLQMLFDFLLHSVSPKLLSGILPNAMQLFPDYIRPQLLAMANDHRLEDITKNANTSYDSVRIWYTKAALAKAI